jgi:hypothetical protein
MYIILNTSEFLNLKIPYIYGFCMNVIDIHIFQATF